MREEIRMVPRTVYIANDGTEYNDQYDCMAHETDLLAKTAEANVQRIPSFTYTPELAYSDTTWMWYFVSTKSELEDVLAFHEIAQGPFGFDPASVTKFPCCIAVCVSDYDHEANVEGTAEEVIERLHEYERDLLEAIESKRKEI